MSILLDTSLGPITIDLFTDEAPKTSKNFMKLVKKKYYNNNVFHNVQKGYWMQTGDPTGTGRGGKSIYGEFFEDELRPKLRHSKAGIVTMANRGKNTNASQFMITVRSCPNLDDHHTVFGEVTEKESFETLEKINKVHVNRDHRPLQNIRIRHTHILFDPFDDPEGMKFPSRSPSPAPDRWDREFIPDYEELSDREGKTQDEINEELEKKTSQTISLMLKMAGDLPDENIRPPDNVLFVCRLNPLTEDADLEIIFSRFGKVLSCEIIRDYITGDSLSYAFLEYESNKECNNAYREMHNALIDERRIKVDFCQSVAKMWGAFQKGGKFAVKNRRAFNANKGNGMKRYGQNRGRKDLEFSESHKLQSSQRLRDNNFNKNKNNKKKERSRSRSRSYSKERKKKKKRSKYSSSSDQSSRRKKKKKKKSKKEKY